MHPASTRDYLYIITPFSLKKRENGVGSVVSVSKSEKSPKKIL